MRSIGRCCRISRGCGTMRGVTDQGLNGRLFSVAASLHHSFGSDAFCLARRYLSRWNAAYGAPARIIAAFSTGRSVAFVQTS
jgi:hypothetical protein